jgi:hypothetical protein
MKNPDRFNRRINFVTDTGRVVIGALVLCKWAAQRRYKKRK